MGCVPTHVSVVGRFKAVVTEVAEFDIVGKYGFKLSWDFPFDFFSFPFYLRSFPKFAGSENWHSPHIYIYFFWLMPKVGIVLLALVQPAHVLLGIRDVGAMFCR